MRKITYIVVIIMVMLLVSCKNTPSNCNVKKCNHEWSEWQSVGNASCDTEGLQERTCFKCKVVQQEKVEAGNHTLSTLYGKTSDGHFTFCTKCDYKTELVSHENGNQTDDGKVTCTKCNYLIKEGTNAFYQNLQNSLQNSFEVELNNVVIKIQEEFTGETITYELKFNNVLMNVDYDENNHLEAYIDGNFYVNLYSNETLTASNNITGKIFIKNNILYVDGIIDTPNLVEDYIGGEYFLKIDLEQIEEENIDIVLDNNELSLLLNNYVAKFNQLFDNYLKFFGTSNNELFKNCLNKIFDVVNTDGVAKFTLNLDYLYELNNDFATKNLSELLDKYVKDGFLEDIINNIDLFLNTKFSRLIEIAKYAYGVDIVETLTIVENLIKELGLDETHNVSFSVQAILTEELMNKSFYEIINEDQEVTYNEVKNKFIDMLSQFGACNVYEFIFGYTSIRNEINDILDEVKEVLKVSFTTDSLGNVTDIYVAIDESSTNINGTIHLTTAKTEFNFDENIELIEGKCDEISFGEMATVEEDESFDVIKDELGNISGFVAKFSVTYDDEVTSNKYLYEYTYTCNNINDLSVVANVGCNSWSYLILLGDFDVETKRQLTNAEGIIETSITTDVTTQFEFNYNFETKQVQLASYDEHVHAFELVETIDPIVDTCLETIVHIYRCQNCNLEVEKYEIIEHIPSDKYEFIFDNGIDCSNGVTVIMYCATCNVELSNEYYLYHKLVVVDEFYYAMEDCKYVNIHGVEKLSCGCKNRKEVSFIGLYNSKSAVDDNGVLYNSHYCNGCDFELREYSTYVEYPDNCETTITIEYQFYKGDKYLDNIVSTSTTYSHELVKEGRLKINALTCEDGLDVYNVCENCGYEEYIEEFFGHEAYDYDCDLSEFGCICSNSYYTVRRCPCGEVNLGIKSVTCENAKFIKSINDVKNDIEDKIYQCNSDNCHFYWSIRQEYNEVSSGIYFSDYYFVLGCNVDGEGGTKVIKYE